MMKLKQVIAAILALVLMGALGAHGISETEDKTKNPGQQQLAFLELEQQNLALIEQISQLLTEHDVVWNRLLDEIAPPNGPVYDGVLSSERLTQLLQEKEAKFSEEEMKTLREDVEKIREIEEQMRLLDQQYEELKQADDALCGNDGLNAEAYFPAFLGKDLDGQDVTSEIFAKNKVTVVNFWFSGCAPCVAELSHLNTLNDALKEKGGAVIGINTDTLDGDEEALAEARYILKKMGAEYQNIWFDSESEAGRMAWGLMAFPTTYVVDQRGVIVAAPLLGGIDHPEVMDALQGQIDAAIEGKKTD